MVAEHRVGFVWLYGLVTLFVLGIIALLIMPAIENQMVPPFIASSTITLSPADAADFSDHVYFVVSMMNKMPFVMMFIVFIYMLIVIFKKETYYYQQ